VTISEARVRWRSIARSSVVWPLLVCLVTAVYVSIPYLLSPWFYQRGDTAAQFAPTWFHLGELVRGGTWPVWMDPDAWAGGNYGAEALFGIYNPLNIAIWLFMSASSDLMLSTFLVKATIMVLLALGTYLLATEYGAAPWAAAVAATALPFSGFTLYWDAGSWPSGLLAFAYLPWVWRSFRRCLRGVSNPGWACAIGVLAATQGNPYGVLGLVIVGVALVVEGALARSWSGVVKLVLVGLCIAAFLPLVYLPLLQVADLGYRTSGPLFANNGKLRPTVGDLFGLSSVTFVPPIRAITGPMQVPATYFSWLLLPLLPWLKYDVLRRRGKELTGVAVVTIVYAMLTLGPATLWLFRWPLRLIEYCYLGLAIALAVVLSEGLQRTSMRTRLAGSAALLALTGYLAWAQNPAALRQTALGVAIATGLTAAVLGWHRFRQEPASASTVSSTSPGVGRLTTRSTAVLAALCILGTGVVLTAQVSVFGENKSSRVWHLPRDVAQLQAQFADRDGLVLQFADLKPLQDRGQIQKLEGSWNDFLPGSMYQVADVKAVNNYTGMGFRPFSKRLCMAYEGLTKSCGYRNVWKPAAPGQPPLIDVMKVDTIVVQTKLTPGVTPDPEWQVVSQSRRVTVLERTNSLPWPDSRLSWVSDGVDVDQARLVSAVEERIRVTTGGAEGQLVFGTLGWPGWEASLDGVSLPVDYGPTGLLTVRVPPGRSGELTVIYRPPGLRIGLIGVGAGTLGALVLAGWSARRRRTTLPDPVAAES
jgi:hypothetical protein